jgi:allophanate hydrolase
MRFECISEAFKGRDAVCERAAPTHSCAAERAAGFGHSALRGAAPRFTSARVIVSIAQPALTGISLDLRSLTRAYASAVRTPVQVVDEIYARLLALRHPGVFTHETSHAHARAAAQTVMRRQAGGERLRLYGIPFAVKDNIDVAGIDTTAACPAFAYRAESSARVVETLLAEGAILIGKTNLDQFATGLVGVRTPYGVAANPFSAEHVPGGSSSGSAVAVARGFVSFALGTDTAGSGRVPAAFNNIVGLKPTRGMLSTHGVVPACRSLDCVSVFALTVDDAALVAQLLAGFDERDAYARRQANRWDPRPLAVAPNFRFALPRREDLVISEVAARSQFEQAVAAAEALGGVSGQLPMAAFTRRASRPSTQRARTPASRACARSATSCCAASTFCSCPRRQCFHA